MSDDNKPAWAQITIHQEIDDLVKHGPSLEVIVSALGGGERLSVCAQIDTGASAVCISRRLARRLNLAPFSHGIVRQADMAEDRAFYYKIRLEFPNVGFDMNVAALKTLEDPHDVVIGTNLLQRGRLSVDYETGQTIVFLRPPA